MILLSIYVDRYQLSNEESSPSVTTNYRTTYTNSDSRKF